MAWYNLGHLYQEEKQDLKTAARYYTKGVEECTQGGDCALALALLHEKGQGVPQDSEEALRLARLALERAGDDQQVIDDAQALLGRLESQPDC